MHLFPDGPLNQLKPVQQRRQHTLRAYYPNIYTVILGKTPQKLVQSISKAVGKKLLMHNVANILKEEEKNPYSPSVSDTVFKVGPKFEMIATVTLRLDECSKGMILWFGTDKSRFMILQYTKDFFNNQKF